jgi:hypothetical protein
MFLILICLEEIEIWKVLIASAKLSDIKCIVKGISPFVAYCKKTALNEVPRIGKERNNI